MYFSEVTEPTEIYPYYKFTPVATNSYFLRHFCLPQLFVIKQVCIL